ncbi:hypothetical protein TCAL_12904 [Tigriopus californicus]|uniref:C2H2-type domain-containing protein n=1 Tax=Tigriopus californicus TaxID=6832 RepID=A0A553NB91_TIGCA|nr:zinc finger protein 723-like [Tigriopus californicus]TRY62712.1 hypothetical protein TCAL_12904 [Tigriopus californicus]|eukprot:TCALIF_12904-PA protein Name:"Similar to ZNF879 Zinc finger protein 879 (Homo sapiens)" AED:0.47 eAED:0.47 QI:0/-1/0/1/-1/1/1/0/629
MDFVTGILEHLESPQQSLNLHHLVIQNWIVFQRNTFDYIDEEGDPFISQMFLIEASTGRYIHRAQGQKVDHGVTLDIGLLLSKLSDVFSASRACQGFPIHDVAIDMQTSKVLDYPYKRRVSKDCQFVFHVPSLKPDEDETHARDSVSTCPSCLEAWQDIEAKKESFHKAPGLLPDVEESNPIGLKNGDEEMDRNDESGEGLDELGPMDCETGPLEDSDDLWAVKTRAKRRSRVKKIEETIEDKMFDDVNNVGKIWRCSYCSESFKSQAMLKKHRIEREQKRRKVGCLECRDNSEIITFKQLVEHVTRVHPDKLDQYRKYFPLDQNVEKMNDPRQCSTCNYVSNGSVMNYRHRELHHELGDYRCEPCGVPLLTYYDLMIHNYQKHEKAMEYIQPSSFALEVITHKDGKVEYKKTQHLCPLCPKVYQKKTALFRHMRSKHSWGMFDCKACRESCHFTRDISAHMVHFHSEDPTIKCPNCLEVFSLKQDPQLFNTHYQTCVPGTYQKGSFQCQICGKKYSAKQTLDAHIKMHQGIIRYKCHYCDYGSNHKAVLMEHEKMHLRKQGLTNESSGLVLTHQCDQCGKQFGSRSEVHRHVRVVHEGIKPTFRCKACGEFAKNSWALSKHKREKHKT